MITAPFNFVPLSEEVFFPEWSESVSHDIPFKDGESGIINVKITAKSPIFIRDAKDETKFCNHNGEYYIPGSSLKGMVRNVLEIMSFSKMKVDSKKSNGNIDDNTYAVRDLNNSELYMSKMTPEKISCGWLKKVGKSYIIEDCGTAGRISHQAIDKAFKIDFASHFQSRNFNAKEQTQKTSEYKYNLLSGKDLNIQVDGPFLSEANAKYDKREFYRYNRLSKTEGVLVVTGQPTPRKNSGKMGDGKGFEFLFFDKVSDIALNEKVFENFKFAYFDERKTQPKESPDWNYWKKRLNDGEKVPVFFQKEHSKITNLGLSYLYKLPYKHSTEHGIPARHKNTKVDLAHTMFGYINETESLKGRIQFSHAKATNNVKELPQVSEVLGSPRASYYPIYVKQSSNTYKTYMDDSFNISGLME